MKESAWYVIVYWGRWPKKAANGVQSKRNPRSKKKNEGKYFSQCWELWTRVDGTGHNSAIFHRFWNILTLVVCVCVCRDGDGFTSSRTWHGRATASTWIAAVTTGRSISGRSDVWRHATVILELRSIGRPAVRRQLDRRDSHPIAASPVSPWDWISTQSGPWFNQKCRPEWCNSSFIQLEFLIPTATYHSIRIDLSITVL